MFLMGRVGGVDRVCRRYHSYGDICLVEALPVIHCRLHKDYKNDKVVRSNSEFVLLN